MFSIKWRHITNFNSFLYSHRFVTDGHLYYYYYYFCIIDSEPQYYHATAGEENLLKL